MSRIQSDENTPFLQNSDREYGTSYGNKTVLKWNNISLSVPDPENLTQQKTILDNVSGYANKGELLGIIGASGGGKTSLLAMLSGRIMNIDSLKSTDSIKEGKISYKGFIGNCSNNDTFKILNNNISYVLQEDLLNPEETVEEALITSSVLRNVHGTTDDKEEKAFKVMHALDLTKVSHTMIGSEAMRGVSGGEKKRVSIGIELAVDSDMILLDEPTTGLDNVNAYDVMETLHNLVKENNGNKNCIVCSLHQPSSEIFDLLDRVIIMAQGKIVFSGTKNELVEYIKNVLNMRLSKYASITDYILQQIHYNPDLFIEKWEQHVKNNPKILRQSSITTSTSTSDYLKDGKPVASFGTQLAVCFKRAAKQQIRNKKLFAGRFGSAVMVAIMQVIIFRSRALKHYNVAADGSLKTNGQNNARNRFGAVFFALMFSSFRGMINAVMTFPFYKSVFQKERNANWYYTTPWFIARSTIETFISVYVALVFCLIAKWGVNFNATFADMFLIVMTLTLNGENIGLLIGIYTKDIKMGMMVMPGIALPTVLLSGFWVNLRSVPVWLRVLKWINPFYYALDLFGIAEFNHTGPYGKDIMKQYGMHSSDFVTYFVILLWLTIVYRVAALVILVSRNGL